MAELNTFSPLSPRSNPISLLSHQLSKMTKAAEKLQKERDDYKSAYELIDSRSQSKTYYSPIYLKELQKSNESFKHELLNIKMQLIEKDQAISLLEQQLLTAKTRQNLDNYLIPNDKSVNHRNIDHRQYSEIVSMARSIIGSLRNNRSLKKIFKNIVTSKQNFMEMIENEDYAQGFMCLGKFNLELIEIFKRKTKGLEKLVERETKFVKFSEETEKLGKSEIEQEDSEIFNGCYNRNKEMIEKIAAKFTKEAGVQSDRVVRNDLALERPVNKVSHGKYWVEQFSDHEPSSGIKKSKGTCTLRFEGHEESSFDKASSLYPSTSRYSTGLLKSKSPLRTDISPRSRFDEFKVPVRKADTSKNMQECLNWGKNNFPLT